MGYTITEYGIPPEFLLFQFPLWDTFNFNFNEQENSIFQFPLWDTPSKIEYYNASAGKTFNSLYGILLLYILYVVFRQMYAFNSLYGIPHLALAY